MRNFCFVLFSSLVLLSCSNNDNDTSFEIDGQFTDNVVQCNSVIAEPINCIKYISFIDESKVRILTGGDILEPRDYKIEGNKVITEKPVESSRDITFEIINETTLKRIQDDATF